MITPGVKVLLSQLENRDFLKAINPTLAITDDPVPFPPASPPSQDDLALLKTEGYVEIPALAPSVTLTMANAIRRLREAHLPPLFAYVYDAFWSPLGALDSCASAVLGSDWDVVADFWAWHIDRGENHAGWPPHRGLYEDAGTQDGLPFVVNVWIALTDATPENGCMVIVPATRDNKTDLSDISFSPNDARALPIAGGRALVWNANAIHWGGRSSEHASDARISMSFTLKARSRQGFAVLDRRAPLPYPKRLDLIAQQILTYQSQEAIPPDLLEWARLVRAMAVLASRG